MNLQRSSFTSRSSIPCLLAWKVCLAAVFGLLVAAPVAASQPRPNVLFIAVDDLACTLGCYGDSVAKTPNIDRLAAEGVCFLRAYNQLPLCNPTRASLMTGYRPDKTKVYDLDQHFRTALPNAITIPQAFQAAGYRAARVGKIYHYNVPAAIGTEGFDDPPSWHETINPKGRDKVDEHLVMNAEPHRKISAALSWLSAEGEDLEQTDGMIATEAIRWMRENRDRPFFLGVGFFRPHTPYIAPKKYFQLFPVKTFRLPFAPANDRDDIPLAAFAHNCPVANYNLDRETLLTATSAYYACVSFVDAQVGRLLNAVNRLSIAEKTIVVLWSDHGYHLGEHGGIWQKRTLFEQAARTPLIVHAPDVSGRGATRAVVELLDIYPTLAELASIEAPADLHGKSLVPLLNDPAKTWNGTAVTQVLRPADDRLPKPVMGRSIRTDRYRFTQWGEGMFGEELYDHHSDPNEFKNLAIDPDAATQEVMDRLKGLLDARASGRVPSTPFNPTRL
ncbi:MAG: sulfatase [Pirellulaceae bacterium]